MTSQGPSPDDVDARIRERWSTLKDDQPAPRPRPRDDVAAVGHATSVATPALKPAPRVREPKARPKPTRAAAPVLPVLPLALIVGTGLLLGLVVGALHQVAWVFVAYELGIAGALALAALPLFRRDDVSDAFIRATLAAGVMAVFLMWALVMTVSGPDGFVDTVAYSPTVFPGRSFVRWSSTGLARTLPGILFIVVLQAGAVWWTSLRALAAAARWLDRDLSDL